MVKLRLLVFLAMVIIINAHGQLKLPSLFGDHMVLQQNENVSIWGTDIPDTNILIETSWGEIATTKTTSEGNWTAKLKTTNASFTGHSIHISGSSKIILTDVLLGEIWFCSGQSNMEMPLKGLGKSTVQNSEKYIQTASNDNIRLFNNQRAASLLPSDDVNGVWEKSNSTSAGLFSAIGYIFATRLFNTLNVPIGIIESAWGGTRIESWIPKDYLLKYEGVKIPDSLSPIQDRQKQASFLYNAMIYPFKNFKIKGFLWYQGESNRTNPSPYFSYMKDLVTAWRLQWENDKLPFYFVQIAPYAYEKNRNTHQINANLIRIAQLKASQEIPHMGMVVTTDAGDCNDIHPSKKEIVATRLANWALAKAYSFDEISHRSPEYQAMKLKKSKIILSFRFFETDKIKNSFDTNEIKNFAIAGEDQKFYPATVKINKNQTLTVHNKKVKKPLAVRYGFEDCFEGSLKTNSGLPISPFRTDYWSY